MHKELEAVITCYDGLAREALAARRKHEEENRGVVSWVYHGLAYSASQAIGAAYYYSGAEIPPDAPGPQEPEVFPKSLLTADYVLNNLNVPTIFKPEDWERVFYKPYFCESAIKQFETDYTTKLSLLATRLRSGDDLDIRELEPFIKALQAFCERLYAIELAVGLLPKIHMDDALRRQFLFELSDLFDLLDASRKGLNEQNRSIDPNHALMGHILALLKVLPVTLHTTATKMNKALAEYGYMSKYSEHRVKAAVKEAVRWYVENKPQTKKIMPFTKELSPEALFEPVLKLTRGTAYEILGAALKLAAEPNDTHFLRALDKIPYYAGLGENLKGLDNKLKETCEKAHAVASEVDAIVSLAGPKG